MTNAIRNLPVLEDAQALASDPHAHVWLSASAGTGKTQVLSARVFRLLLRGVSPSAILCLTFTKAGAAEMAERINGRLAQWVRMDANAVRADLTALGEAPDDALIARARTLFAAVLESPGGGIRIQTIHGFCQSLLAAFPLEAGLVPGFRPLEGREEAVMAREALAELLVREEALGGSAVLDAIAAMSLRLGEGAAESFLAACARADAALEELPSGIQPWLRRALDLPGGDVEAAVARACGDGTVDEAALRRIIAANVAWGTATGAKTVEAVALWLAADPAGRAAMLDDLLLVFRTGKGEPRKASAKLIAAEPDYVALAEQLGEECAALIGLRARAAYADGLAAALHAGREYARVYRAAKRRVGAVDFNDLIRETRRLLAQPGIGEWVRYKLDLVTEHVLIDEAQDTNWDQWEIIAAIADEFFAGAGVRAGDTRTLFTVGDYKQAIFGFQGTDPRNFAMAQRRFELKAQVAPGAVMEGAPVLPFHQLSLTHSFRSAAPILSFVDASIAALPPGALGAFSDIEPHGTRVPGNGLVSLWRPDLGGASDAEGEEEGWVDDATRALAKRIARYVKGWIAAGRGDAGDVMILVRRRGDLASLIVARLYAEGVPVAGVDRLRLNAPLAVQDLLAAIRFVLQPDDDLSLASLLVSPLIGWSQDNLMTAAPRGDVTLWRHLRATQPEERLAPLHAMLNRADFTTPYQFLEGLLSGPMAGRRRLRRRLGEEAVDPIEELLTAALDFERLATPSLQRFLDWFDRGEVEIKRDASQRGSAVRVMTAHGAKGLQAPLVILADATADPENNRRDQFEWAPEAATPPIPLYRPRKEERGDVLGTVMAETEAREREEHWRLFYVAATRAERELVIAGALGPKAKGEVPAMSWHALAGCALDALDVAPLGEGEEARHYGSPHQPRGRTAAPAEAKAGAEALPDWLHRSAPQEARPPRPLAPSSLGEDAVADPPPTPAMRAAADRGRLIHALLERLPGVAAERQEAAAERWLAQAAGIEDAGERAAVAGAALNVIRDPRFAELFGPDALAEAPIAAVVDGFVVAGTADRLLVRDDRVVVVDFKTGRRAPLDLSEVPPYHLRQMAAYAAALGVIFPGRRIEAALLYTSAARLIPIPDETLSSLKANLSAGEQS